MVGFWKRIYTEVSLTQGLLHDREYPTMVYKKITFGDRSGRTKYRFIQGHRDRLKADLRAIATGPAENLTARQKELAQQLEEHIPAHDRADAHTRIRFQQGQRERFRRGLERSGAYLDTIKTLLARYEVPQRLCYLPHVESSFNPHAYSKVGAAGLWQFMRATGRRYMRIDYVIDERRDPIRSSEAAAKLLSTNYRSLQSWPLAITAYNHGRYGMQRAVRQVGSRDIADIIAHYQSRSFRFSSKNFYACFLAASDIAHAYSRYFGPISFAPAFKAHTFTLPEYVGVDVLCDALGISASTFRSYNPALRDAVFDVHRRLPSGYTYNLPPSITTEQARLAFAAIPDSLRHKKLPTPRYYKVQRGDNLYRIARRLDVSMHDIALANDLARMSRIYPGQVLRIPGAAPATPKSTGVAMHTPAPASEQTAKAAPAPSAEQPAAQKTKRGATAAPTPAPAPAPVPVETDVLVSTPPPAHSFSQFDAQIYTLSLDVNTDTTFATLRVSINETLGHYADWLGIATQRIRNVNRMGYRSRIHIGDRIRIPISDTAVETFNARRLEYHMAIEEDFFSHFTVVDATRTRIRSGDSLWELCNEYTGTPLWLFKKINPSLDLDKPLIAGMHVWIPVIEPRSMRMYTPPFTQLAPGQNTPIRLQASPVRLLP
jgi:membrane-bound lytic murein transglycosylase D